MKVMSANALSSKEAARPKRSEEHTPELQSQFQLVCRLLLEKKKHQPFEGFAVSQVRPDQLTPVRALPHWSCGVSISRQVDKARSGAALEKIDGLRARWELASESQPSVPRKRVDGARCASVRASGESHFGAYIRRQLIWLMIFF